MALLPAACAAVAECGSAEQCVSLMQIKRSVLPGEAGAVDSSIQVAPSLPGSWCYKDPWVAEMMRADPDGSGKVFVDIGCNTGSDAVMWLERWGKTAGVARRWDKALARSGVSEGRCGENVFGEEPRSAAGEPDAARRGEPRVLCVEPMPRTAKLLRALKAELFGREGPLEVVQAAASDQVTNDTIPFPDGPAGKEDFGINNFVGGENNTVRPALVPVAQVTVDQLISQRGFKTVDVLTIDTEGHDPVVLRGAEAALRKGRVRLLVFEVHQDLSGTAWATTKLNAVLQQLDSFQYDCYMTDNAGPLHRLTGVWDAEMEEAHWPVCWSNVACVRRGDVWHAVLQRYDAGL